MTIKQANVTLMVGDMKKAIEFYTGVLGLKLRPSAVRNSPRPRPPGR